jgi:hypothetical protein
MVPDVGHGVEPVVWGPPRLVTVVVRNVDFQPTVGWPVGPKLQSSNSPPDDKSPRSGYTSHCDLTNQVVAIGHR